MNRDPLYITVGAWAFVIFCIAVLAIVLIGLAKAVL